MSLVVYKHTNIKNNKVYIGQTKNYNKRCSPCNYKGSPYFYKAIQKYGWDNFIHEFLKTNLSQKEANYWECYYINLYNSTNPLYGYNISGGGGHKNALYGEQNGFYSHTHTEESLEIMRSKKRGGNNPNAKPILCINTGQIFPSGREASDWCGTSRNNITRCARGERPSAGKHPITKDKLKWRYI